MTYGMILAVIGISFFSVFFASVLFVWRFRARTKRLVEQTYILQDMVDFNVKYLLCMQRNGLRDMPCINARLRNTYITIKRIIEKSDYGYDDVKISSYRRGDWFREFFDEYQKADEEIKNLLEMNSNLVDRVYKNKSPIKFFFHTIKKNMTWRILYFVARVVVFFDESNILSSYGKNSNSNDVGKMVGNEMLQEV